MFDISTTDSIIQATANGIETTNRESILEYLLTKFKALFGANAEVGVGTEDYNMLSLFADLLSDMGSTAVTVGNGYSLPSATGFQLDNIASIFYGNVSRRVGTASKVTVTLTGTAGTSLYSPYLKDAFGGTWLLPEQVTFNQSGVAVVTATYSEVGAYTLTDDSQLSGTSAKGTADINWTDVQADIDTLEVGSPLETDTELRLRLAQAQFGTAQTITQSLRTALLSLKNGTENIVDKVAIWENDTNSSLPFSDELTVPAHTIAISVAGNLETVANKQMVADAIYLHKGQGVGTFAPTPSASSISQDVSRETMGDNLTTATTPTIYFTIATEQSVNVAIQLIKDPASIIPTEADNVIRNDTGLKNAVGNALAKIGIGETVYAVNTLKDAISQYLELTYKGAFTMVNVGFGSSKASSVQLAYNEYITLGTLTNW